MQAFPKLIRRHTFNFTEHFIEILLISKTADG